MSKRFTKYPRSYIHCSQIPVKELQPDMVIHDGSHDGIVERVQDVTGIDRIAVTIDGITYRFPPDDMIEILDDSEFVVDYIDPDDRAQQLTVTAKTPSDAIEVAQKQLGKDCEVVNLPRLVEGSTDIEEYFKRRDEIPNPITYRQIYDRVHGKYHNPYDMVTAIARLVYAGNYQGYGNESAKGAVATALELLEDMTGRWWDPDIETFNEIVDSIDY